MPDARFIRNPTILHSQLGDDVVALSVERGLCFAMPDTTAAIWHLLEEPRTLAEIVDALSEEYDVETEDCRNDVRAILVQLEEAALVSRHDGR